MGMAGIVGKSFRNAQVLAKRECLKTYGQTGRGAPLHGLTVNGEMRAAAIPMEVHD
jgi:hypothetical protein